MMGIVLKPYRLMLTVAQDGTERGYGGNSTAFI